MRFLVTGATGFIGGALAARLLARGDRVRALVRDPARAGELSRLGAELAPGALDDAPCLARAVDGCDVVLHLAGLVKARRASELFAVNRDGTANLARACAGAATAPRLVHVSSIAAAGPSSPSRARSEDDAPAPVSDYGRSKLAGEEAVRAVAGAVRVSIVRPPIVYGPGDKELVPPTLALARAGLVLRAGSASKRFSIVHVADLCDGIIQVAERGKRLGATGGEGVYFLDDGVEHAWEEIGRAACAALGRRPRVVALPEVLTYALAAGATAAAALRGGVAMMSFDKIRELKQPSWTCTSARARREVGYAPKVGLMDGMRDAAAWQAAHRSAA